MIIVIFVFFTFFYPENRAEEVVEKFYDYEINGLFSESWELFHPLMKEKIPKGEYIQERAGFLVNHLEVTTSNYSIEDTKKLENWQMEAGAEGIPEVFKVLVSQEFNGKYGKVTIKQNVYVTDVDGEWKILWDYKE